MAHIVNSILINAPYDQVFDFSNDLSRWREFRNQFSDIKLLKKDNDKVFFQLTHNNQMSWRVYRRICKEDGFVCAFD